MTRTRQVMEMSFSVVEEGLMSRKEVLKNIEMTLKKAFNPSFDR